MGEGESWEGGKGGLTSLSILTLALMPSTSASFWFSSSERTASLYWPLCGLEHLSVSVVTCSFSRSKGYRNMLKSAAFDLI